MSVKSSSPKIVFNSWTAFVFPEATILSILSIMAFTLAIQSDGPNCWIGSYLASINGDLVNQTGILTIVGIPIQLWWCHCLQFRHTECLHRSSMNMRSALLPSFLRTKSKACRVRLDWHCHRLLGKLRAERNMHYLQLLFNRTSEPVSRDDPKVGHTLLGGHVSQFICRTTGEWIALSIVSIFQDDSQTIRSFHQDLYNCERFNLAKPSILFWRLENERQHLTSGLKV